jgi:hypothetical protein
MMSEPTVLGGGAPPVNIITTMIRLSILRLHVGSMDRLDPMQGTAPKGVVDRASMNQ